MALVKSLSTNLFTFAEILVLGSHNSLENNVANRICNFFSFLDLLSRRNFTHDFDNQFVKRKAAIKKRDRKVVEDLKIYEEKGFLRRLAIPATEYSNLFANSALPIKRAKQIFKSSSWRDLSKCFRLIVEVNFYCNEASFVDLYSVNIDEKIREGIDKYKEIGLAKKQLYSMPQYFRDRDRKGIKLPANKIKGELADKDLYKFRGDCEWI